ncbi:protease inhibitor I42 family protein [Methanobacterium sp. MBAC-LM]|uniref:protease inhibitor I42 family protein n=1 Tax=Methanobacterium sp. MBAC-LM TaxID=3412034 RepID=UPI003C7848DA
MRAKIAVLLMAFLCLSLVTSSFAAAPSTNSVEKTIKVVSNPSTGYHWVAVYNKNHVKLLSDTFKSNNPRLIGSPGIETFKFKGDKGQRIVLKYVRSGDNKPVKQHTYVL